MLFVTILCASCIHYRLSSSDKWGIYPPIFHFLVLIILQQAAVP
uniref:Uncharacterized protein n=1 Tax=Arundo donax TaxID=35708 RepID=A0A0A9H7L3_ARUDO